MKFIVRIFIFFTEYKKDDLVEIDIVVLLYSVILMPDFCLPNFQGSPLVQKNP